MACKAIDHHAVVSATKANTAYWYIVIPLAVFFHINKKVYRLLDGFSN